MQICLTGWDFNKSLYTSLSKTCFDKIAILHREGDTKGVPFCLIPNIGLEWGSYDYFLKNIWDKKSSVLFMQDDISIKDDSFFEQVSKLENDFIFIHDNQSKTTSSEVLFSGTGQCFKASPKFLYYIWKTHGGFWYDENNLGDVINGNPHAAIGIFIQRLRQIEIKKVMSVNNHVNMSKYIIIN